MGEEVNAYQEEHSNTANDERVVKLKEHWETVSSKVDAHIKSLEQMNGELIIITHFLL